MVERKYVFLSDETCPAPLYTFTLKGERETGGRKGDGLLWSHGVLRREYVAKREGKGASRNWESRQFLDHKYSKRQAVSELIT